MSAAFRTHRTEPNSPLNLALGLVVLVALAALSWFALRWATSIEPQTLGIFVAAGTALLGHGLKQRWERQVAEVAKQRELRTPVYERTFGGLLDLLMAEKNGDAKSDLKKLQSLKAYFLEVTPRLAIYASDEVVKRWSELRTLMVTSSENPDVGGDLLKQYGQLVLLMRRDLGYKNDDLTEKDVLKLFINDVDSSPVFNEAA